MNDQAISEILENKEFDRLEKPETYTGLAEELVMDQLQEIEVLQKLDPDGL